MGLTTAAEEVRARAAIYAYVEMVVLIGAGYNPDCPPTDYRLWSGTVNSVRSMLAMNAPDVNEYDLTLRVFRMKGWI